MVIDYSKWYRYLNMVIDYGKWLQEGIMIKKTK